MIEFFFEESPYVGYFRLNGVDYPKGHYGIKYDGDLDDLTQEGRNFSIFDINTRRYLKDLKSRHYSEVDGVNSWGELLNLLKDLEVINRGGSVSFNEVKADLTGRQSLSTIFGDSIVGIRKTSIGAQFQYGVEDGSATPEIVGSGSVATVESLLTISTGTDTNGKAGIESVETIRYVPGQETYCYLTLVFTSPKLNSTQRGGLFDSINGFFVAYEADGKFYFVRRRNGVDYRNEIDLVEFSEKYGYQFDPTKGNIYRISYGYLGFAPISLEVVRPEGGFAILSRINYPNSETVTHTLQTFLPVRGEVENVGNDTDIVLKSGSLAAGITDGGVVDVAGRRFNYANEVSFPVAGNTTLVAFRNKTTFQGIKNRVSARLLQISGANDLNKNVRWKLYKNPTYLNTPTWVDVDLNNSILQYSEDAVVDIANSNDLFLAWNISRLGDFFENVESLELDLLPNWDAAFVIETASTGGDADLSIRWNELF